jgi:regulator of RNase E activity RraB
VSNWQFYLSREKSGVARNTAVDLSLLASAPQEQRPNLMWVWIAMKSATAHGLVGSDEAPLLDQMQAAVSAELQRGIDALAVARVDRERRCELWFYGNQVETLEQTAATAMSGFADYRFITGSRADPQWTCYLSEFYPADPKRWHQVVNNQLIQTLKGRGDVLESAHRLDHTLFFKTREGRDRFVAAARQQGYVIGGEFEDRDKRVIRFGVVVNQQLPRINLASMNQVVFRLIDLAAPFDGTYDGWGTMQVRVAS